MELMFKFRINVHYNRGGLAHVVLVRTVMFALARVLSAAWLKASAPKCLGTSGPPRGQMAEPSRPVVVFRQKSLVGHLTSHFVHTTLSCCVAWNIFRSVSRRLLRQSEVNQNMAVKVHLCHDKSRNDRSLRKCDTRQKFSSLTLPFLIAGSIRFQYLPEHRFSID